ncbi:STAS-like domain-containing protein [Paractinoplanes lichenicola]|uniref:STAS-like domain-containing protein n=1 Tax=Paractinoplanes lichenicola TaxID=2802976 RepID=A0ABS1W4D8_9ACTN|nr:DUF4325 domain-containing protein [Actinoplanes lichenicola]MBL7261580.1 STAS-like domain-containing protein [Actinoplanes lichenicola]
MKPEPAAPFTFPVAKVKDFLTTRDLAKRTLRDLQDETPENTETVIIDFDGVVAMTISFADEFLGEYYSALAGRDALPAVVALTGLHEELRETIDICLQRRDLIAAEERLGAVTLLAASNVITETFELAQELARRVGAFTAMNAASQLNISAPNANNRLKKLVSARALIRQHGVAERGGKEFTYVLPKLAAATPHK